MLLSKLTQHLNYVLAEFGDTAVTIADNEKVQALTTKKESDITQMKGYDLLSIAVLKHQGGGLVVTIGIDLGGED